jgi:PadR family transcriptional regulator
MRPNTVKGHLDALILATLDAGPAHGYAVGQALRERSDGAFDLPEGTIYPALHRLERDGLLASEWSLEAGRRRRIYRLTQTGASALGARRREWRAFAGAVQAVLG